MTLQVNFGPAQSTQLPTLRRQHEGATPFYIFFVHYIHLSTQRESYLSITVSKTTQTQTQTRPHIAIIAFQNLFTRHGFGCFGFSNHDQVAPARTVALRSRTHPFRRASPPQPKTKAKAWIARDGYEDVTELQHGSEAKTYLTKSITTGRLYVVKRFANYPEYVRDPLSQNGAQPLPKEAMVLLINLRPHPNILQVFGCDLFGDRRSNLYSEYQGGGDLCDQVAHLAKLNRTAPERFVLKVFISLSYALCYLHHGLRWDPEANRYWQEPGFTSYLHGDVKLENCFMAFRGNELPDIVLGDFGHAQPANHFRGISGTVGYQAPEIAAVYKLRQTDREAYNAAMRTTGYMTPAADIYSLGQTIHMLCTGRHHVLGADPKTKPVRSTKKGIVGVKLGGRHGYNTKALTEAIQMLLQTDPTLRPTATEGSLLDAVAVCMEALAEKMEKTSAIPRYMWASPP